LIDACPRLFFKLTNEPSNTNMGGNIECLPPSKDYPFGLIYTSDQLGDDIKNFLINQQVQNIKNQKSILEFDIEPAQHVDEVLTVVPKDKSFAIAIADYKGAFEILEDLDNKAHKELHIEKNYIDFVGSLLNLTLKTIIEAHRNKIEPCQTKADAIISKIKKHYPEIQTIGIPILPIVKLDREKDFSFLPPGAVGLFPNSINMQIVNGKIYIPNCYYKPFNDKISTLNLNGIFVNTLWLWCNKGEVHCGSNLIRKKENIVLEIQKK